MQIKNVCKASPGNLGDNWHHQTTEEVAAFRPRCTPGRAARTEDK